MCGHNVNTLDPFQLTKHETHLCRTETSASCGSQYRRKKLKCVFLLPRPVRMSGLTALLVSQQERAASTHIGVQYWPNSGLNNGQILVDCTGPFVDSQIGHSTGPVLAEKLAPTYFQDLP